MNSESKEHIAPCDDYTCKDEICVEAQTKEIVDAIGSGAVTAR